MPTRQICLVLYPGCQNLDVSGPYEVFAGANRYLTTAGKKPLYALTLATLQRGQVPDPPFSEKTPAEAPAASQQMVQQFEQAGGKEQLQRQPAFQGSYKVLSRA